MYSGHLTIFQHDYVRVARSIQYCVSLIPVLLEKDGYGFVLGSPTVYCVLCTMWALIKHLGLGTVIRKMHCH